MSITVQQDATVYSFIIFSADSSTCFVWYPHPSSRVHSNCNYNIWHWSNRICYCPLRWRSRNSGPTPPRQRTVANTVLPVPYVVITVWWWMRVSSETCRAVCRKYNKTVYSRMLSDNYLHWFTMHGPMNIKFIQWLSLLYALSVLSAKLTASLLCQRLVLATWWSYGKEGPCGHAYPSSMLPYIQSPGILITNVGNDKLH